MEISFAARNLLKKSKDMFCQEIHHLTIKNLLADLVCFSDSDCTPHTFLNVLSIDVPNIHCQGQSVSAVQWYFLSATREKCPFVIEIWNWN